MEQKISNFSNNQKISPRQIQRTLTLEMLGISSLLLPQCLASLCGIDGIAAMVLGALGAALMLRVWKRLARKQDFLQALKQCGKGIKWFLYVCYGVLFLGIAGYVLFLMTNVMEEQLLNVRFQPMILLTLVGAAVFGLLKGMEPRIRIYEVLFWILMVLLLAMLCLAAASVNPDYWAPVADTAPTDFFRGTYLCFLYFSLSSLFLLFQSSCSRPGQAGNAAGKALLAVLILNAAVYLILTGVFQTGLLRELPFPILTLMAVVKLPGEFFERQDAFMIAVWFFGLFALLNSMLFYGKEMLQKAAGSCRHGNSKHTKKNRQGVKNGVWSLICGIAVLNVAVCFLRFDRILEFCERTFIFLLFPFMILAPVLVFLAGNRKGGRAK